MKYTIATENALWDIVKECMTEQDEQEEQDDRNKLTKEQDEILQQAYGENWYTDIFYMIRHKSGWIRNDYSLFCDIDDAINILAIKDGADLVRFENGNLGYVAYYNGMTDIIEIVAKAKDIEEYIYSLDGNEVDVEVHMEELEEVELHSLEEIKAWIYNYLDN